MAKKEAKKDLEKELNSALAEERSSGLVEEKVEGASRHIMRSQELKRLLDSDGPPAKNDREACPKCGCTELRSRTTQLYLILKCTNKACYHEWQVGLIPSEPGPRLPNDPYDTAVRQHLAQHRDPRHVFTPEGGD